MLLGKRIVALVATIAALSGCDHPAFLSDADRREVAAVTCSIISETRNMDAAVRVREVNQARERLGEPAYLEGDETIKAAVALGLCNELVRNAEDYRGLMQRKAEALVAEEKREAELVARREAEEAARINAEMEAAAERARIASEKRAAERAADRQAAEEERRQEELAAKRAWEGRIEQCGAGCFDLKGIIFSGELVVFHVDERGRFYGVEVDDRLTHVEGQSVAPSTAASLIEQLPSGSNVAVRLSRDGQTLSKVLRKE